MCTGLESIVILNINKYELYVYKNLDKNQRKKLVKVKEFI